MAKIAREMVEKAGVDVDKLVDLLVKNASAELTTYLLLHHHAGQSDWPGG